MKEIPYTKNHKRTRTAADSRCRAPAMAAGAGGQQRLCLASLLGGRKQQRNTGNCREKRHKETKKSRNQESQSGKSATSRVRRDEGVAAHGSKENTSNNEKMREEEGTQPEDLSRTQKALISAQRNKETTENGT